MNNPNVVMGTAEARTLTAGWKEGPLPPDTYYWGGVITKDMLAASPRCYGFSIGDFCGNHVKVGEQRVEAADVALYNNSLQLPYGFS